MRCPTDLLPAQIDSGHCKYFVWARQMRWARQAARLAGRALAGLTAQAEALVARLARRAPGAGGMGTGQTCAPALLGAAGQQQGAAVGATGAMAMEAGVEAVVEGATADGR
jgi:hypothetical protein